MDFRDFEIENHINDTIVIRQSDHNGGHDSLFLDKAQIGFFISKLLEFSGKKVTKEYSAMIIVSNNGEEYSHSKISSLSMDGLEDEKQYFFDAFVYDKKSDPYRKNDITMSNFKKKLVIDITEDI